MQSFLYRHMSASYLCFKNGRTSDETVVSVTTTQIRKCRCTVENIHFYKPCKDMPYLIFENPKSDTLALPKISTKIFDGNKFRCNTGGFWLCRYAIPIAVSLAMVKYLAGSIPPALEKLNKLQCN